MQERAIGIALSRGLERCIDACNICRHVLQLRQHGFHVVGATQGQRQAGSGEFDERASRMIHDVLLARAV
jgi:hypothetical protein